MKKQLFTLLALASLSFAIKADDDGGEMTAATEGMGLSAGTQDTGSSQVAMTSDEGQEEGTEAEEAKAAPMTRKPGEFLAKLRARFEAMPEEKKAEISEGVKEAKAALKRRAETLAQAAEAAREVGETQRVTRAGFGTKTELAQMFPKLKGRIRELASKYDTYVGPKEETKPVWILGEKED